MFGGLAYVLLSILYLVFVSGFSWINLMIVAPFIIMGGIFIGRYFYEKK
jgi:putative flippase GtrA